jgi:hypothetical protein
MLDRGSLWVLMLLGLVAWKELPAQDQDTTATIDTAAANRLADSAIAKYQQKTDSAESRHRTRAGSTRRRSLPPSASPS